MSESGLSHASTVSDPLLPLVWEHLDKARSSGRAAHLVEDLLAPLAGLLVLRWAAFFDAEREAVAAFDAAAFEPSLPRGLRNMAWRGDIAKSIGTALATLPRCEGPAYADYPALVAPILQRFVAQSGEMFSTLLDWVVSVDFD